jgi:hypothetical protein
MKRQITGLLFAFLTCFATVNVSGEEEGYFIPLTWEIVRNQKDNLKKAHFYLSKSFSIKVDNQSNVKGGFNEKGMYEVSEEKTSSPIPFSNKEIGEYDNILDAPKGGETLEISFKERSVRLKFVRNMSKNRFELAYAVINNRNFYFSRFPDEPPYLKIRTNQKGSPDTEIRAVLISDARNLPPSRYSMYPEEGGSQITASAKYGAIYIAGQGSLNKSTVISYIRHRNPNVSPRAVENIRDMYFWAAGREKINPDIPIAQMCLSTIFFSNEIAMRTHNYAGFKSTPEWPVVFYDMRYGIVAHIQHLKGYSSYARPSDLAEPLADIRWNLLDSFRGTIHTLEDLARKWAPNNPRAYEDDIKDIIYEMRLFSRQSI